MTPKISVSNRQRMARVDVVALCDFARRALEACLERPRRKSGGLANFAVPKAKLRDATTKLAQKLMKLNPNVVRYTKEAIRAVRFMTDKQARDHLKSKQDSLSRNDQEIREQHGMKQFLDDKSYRPGLGPFKRVESA